MAAAAAYDMSVELCKQAAGQGHRDAIFQMMKLLSRKQPEVSVGWFWDAVSRGFLYSLECENYVRKRNFEKFAEWVDRFVPCAKGAEEDETESERVDSDAVADKVACVVDRRTKEKVSRAKNTMLMRHHKDHISFLKPPNLDAVPACMVKLYVSENNQFLASENSESLTLETVVWDHNVDPFSPLPIEPEPLLRVGALVCDKNSPSKLEPGSCFLCERGIYFVGTEGALIPVPVTAFCRKVIDLSVLVDDTKERHQVSCELKGSNLSFYLDRELICSVFCHAEARLGFISTDRRVCSIAVRVKNGTLHHTGKVWKVAPLRKNAYRDKKGVPYTIGLEKYGNDIFGETYEVIAMNLFRREAKKIGRDYLVPQLLEQTRDNIGPVLITTFVNGVSPRSLTYEKNWMTTGLLTDVLYCCNIMYTTRTVHEDFYLRNIIACLDFPNRTCRCTMIDFDRVRSFRTPDTDALLNQWISASLMQVLMELAYIMHNLPGSTASYDSKQLVLRMMDLVTFGKSVYVIKKGLVYPNWDHWKVWYESSHECNDTYYMEVLKGTNLRYAPQDPGLIVPYISVISWLFRFLAAQVSHDKQTSGVSII